MTVEFQGMKMPVERALALKAQQEAELETAKSDEAVIEEVVETVVEPVAEVVSEEETVETPVLTVEEMKQKLTDAWIEFHHALGEKKLLDLIEANNL